MTFISSRDSECSGMLTWTPKPSRSWRTVAHAHSSYTVALWPTQTFTYFESFWKLCCRAMGPGLFTSGTDGLCSALCSKLAPGALLLTPPHSGCGTPVFSPLPWWRLGRGAETQPWRPEVRFVVTLSLGTINAIIRK